MKEFNSIEEIEKYYNKETSTYIFKENDKYIDVNFNFDLIIKGKNIDAYNINAGDINAGNIDAKDISFFAVLLACQTLKCNSATGTRKNAKIICLDSEPIIGSEN